MQLMRGQRQSQECMAGFGVWQPSGPCGVACRAGSPEDSLAAAPSISKGVEEGHCPRLESGQAEGDPPDPGDQADRPHQEGEEEDPRRGYDTIEQHL